MLRFDRGSSFFHFPRLATRCGCLSHANNRDGLPAISGQNRTILTWWRRAWEYNEERPKKAMGELTPSAFAKQLASTTINPGL